MRKICLALGLICLLGLPLEAGSNSDSSTPLAVSGIPEVSDHVLVSSGTDQFAVYVPDGFRLGEVTGGKVHINNVRLGFFITMTMNPSGLDSAKPQAAALAQRYPDSKVLLQYTRPVFGRVCNAYDIAWKTSDNIMERTRIVVVPTGTGLLEITCNCGANQFSKGEGAFNLFLSAMTEDVKSVAQRAHHQGPVLN